MASACEYTQGQAGVELDHAGRGFRRIGSASGESSVGVEKAGAEYWFAT
jgi:hypothetical protein